MLNQNQDRELLDLVTDKYEEQDFITTGYKQLDKMLNGGLRSGCCYLVAGIEKSGKSSLLFNILNQKILDDTKCGYLSTEMEFKRAITRMFSSSGIDNNDISGKIYWRKQLRDHFQFTDPEQLLNNGKFSFPLFIKNIEEMVNNGTKLVVIDNLTSLGAESGDYKALGSYISQLVSFVKGKKVAVIFVLHVKPTVTFRETAEGVRQIINSGKPDKMLESATIIGRPSLADIYGGGQALSQISGGAILVWRPFQKFNNETFRRTGLVIVDTHRFGPSGEVEIRYDGDTGKFWEVSAS